MRMMKKLISAATASVMTLSMTAGFSHAGALDLLDKTAIDLVNEMGSGWNLGNTFDSVNTWDNPLTVEKIETGWGNPVTTQAMLDAIHKAGFDSVRIPVTWMQMTENGTIKEEYLARVKEVVNYAYGNNMYVIINMHHDGLEGNWLNAGTAAKDQFTKMWTQIADYFSDYGQHLVFEGWNEIAWDNGTCLTMGQAFVDAVRATGGNNANRLLVIPGPNTNIAATLDSGFQMPKDAANMLAVDVHHYDPTNFTVCTPGTEENEWWKASATWGTDEEINAVKANIANLKAKFVDNGIGVIFGEYGVENEQKEEASRLLYTKTVASYARAADGFAAYLWDSGNSGDMKYFDRLSLTWLNPEIGTMFGGLGSGGTGSLVVDWVPTAVSAVIDDKTGSTVPGSYQISVGTSTKFKIELTSQLTNVKGTGGISYWDKNANQGAGAWVQNGLSVSWSIDQDGNCEVNQVEPNFEDDLTVINRNFFELPEGVSTDSVQFQIYYGYYTDKGGTLDASEYPSVSKAYVTGLVEVPNPTEPTEPTVESTEPTEPTVESTEPTEPTVESTEPTEPTEPTVESTEPTEPTAESTEPTAESTEPTEPTDPTGIEPTENPFADLLCGDVNLDGEIDILDVITVNKYLLGSITLSEGARYVADVDASTKIDSTDSLIILKKVVKLIDTLPV